MITKEPEQVRAGDGGDFADAVALDFCDHEHELFGAVWLTRAPNGGLSRSNVVLFLAGDLVTNIQKESETAIQDWGAVRVDGVSMQTAEPLERWMVETQGDQGDLHLEVEALSAPRELPEGVAAAVGVEQYEQRCRLTGTVDVAGRTYPVRCLGRRSHWWGEFPWNRIDRWRTLYAASASGRAISAVAALPAGSEGHDAEMRAAQFLDDPDALPFDDVRLSTVYGDDGMPAKVGLELWRPDDEYPQRLGGSAICGTRRQRADHELVVSFFRWSIDGEPAYGCYELARRT
jgi:hypothetical protein